MVIGTMACSAAMDNGLLLAVHKLDIAIHRLVMMLDAGLSMPAISGAALYTGIDNSI